MHTHKYLSDVGSIVSELKLQMNADWMGLGWINEFEIDGMRAIIERHFPLNSFQTANSANHTHILPLL